jgi:hypothetical protein
VANVGASQRAMGQCAGVSAGRRRPFGRVHLAAFYPPKSTTSLPPPLFARRAHVRCQRRRPRSGQASGERPTEPYRPEGGRTAPGSAAAGTPATAPGLQSTHPPQVHPGLLLRRLRAPSGRRHEEARVPGACSPSLAAPLVREGRPGKETPWSPRALTTVGGKCRSVPAGRGESGRSVGTWRGAQDCRCGRARGGECAAWGGRGRMRSPGRLRFPPHERDQPEAARPPHRHRRPGV